MTTRILAIGDTANIISSLRPMLKHTIIHIIDFANSKSNDIKNNKEIFDSNSIIKNTKKINKIKNNFDLCLVTGWSAARIAYLADLNYIMYFVGTDIRAPLFEKNPKTPYNKNPLKQQSYFDRKFYRKILNNSISCVATFEERYLALKKYRKDAIRIDRIAFSKSLFKNKDSSIKKSIKFTFFSPSKIGVEKGFDIIWKALEYCKTDFEILQVNHVIEESPDKNLNKKLLKEKPKQVKLIPPILRENILDYYEKADAVIGSMGVDYPEGVALEAIMCKKPVLSYNNPDRNYVIGDEIIKSPFEPQTKDPIKIAKIIDQIVESSEYRLELAKSESNFIAKISDPEKVSKEWDGLFEKFAKQYKTINKNSNNLQILSRFLYLILIKINRILR